MTFIRYHTYGNQEYAYEVTSYWDKEKQISRQRTKYLGVVIDKQKHIFEKKWQTQPERLILDFGDTYVIDQFFEQSGFSDLLNTIFGASKNIVLSLIYYRLCHNAAMMYAERWFEGNYVRKRFTNMDLSSQKVREYLMSLANEITQRKFFEEYTKRFSHSKRGVIIDGASLPNQIHNPMTTWGRSEEEIDKQVRFLLAVDRDEHLPLFFRLLPGNIIDVSSLQNTLYELKNYGVNDAYVLLDAGFFSDENIRDMYKNNIDFVVRLPSGRILYKELIQKEGAILESKKNLVRYGKRGLFVKEVEIELLNKKAFAYVVQDPMRRGREMARYILDSVDDGVIQEDENYEIINKGIMVVISSFKISKDEIVPFYYIRQTAEVFFGFSKDDLAILPLRVHSHEGIRGFIFLQFLTLIAFTQLKNKLGKAYTVDEVLLSMRNLKCKVYDKDILINEVTKEQREMAEKLGVLVPKNLGI